MDIAATVIDLLRQRAQGVSICPSDVARALADECQPYMTPPLRWHAWNASSSRKVTIRSIRPMSIKGRYTCGVGPMFPAK